MSFKSGFLIFIELKCSLECNQSTSIVLPELYKNLIINNKLSLFEQKDLVNDNSLKFLFFKLGLFYKEIYLINKGLINLKYYDLKTSHILMQYILQVADMKEVLENKYDNFYFTIIQKTITFLINLYASRVSILKDDNTYSQNIVYSRDFNDIFKSNRVFRELIIITKYLDILRNLENEIFYRFNKTQMSLKNTFKNLKIHVDKKNFNSIDNLSYFKIQLYEGNISNTQFFVLDKLVSNNNNSKEISSFNKISSNLNLNSYNNFLLLNRILIEIFVYKIMENTLLSCKMTLKILRNVSYNANIIYKNIAMKTQIKKLRDHIFYHLKHVNFITPDEDKLFNVINNINKYYENYPFSINYKLKSLNIAQFKEYKEYKFNYLSNDNYIISNIDKEVNDLLNIKNVSIYINSSNSIYNYSAILDNITDVNNNLKLDKNNKKYIEAEKLNNKYNKNYELNFQLPFITSNNIKRIENRLILNKDNPNSIIDIESFIFIKELYSLLFQNLEIDDFGMDKNNYLNDPIYLDSEQTKMIQFLFKNYFLSDDSTLEMLLSKDNNMNCKLCKIDKNSNIRNLSNPFNSYKDNNINNSNLDDIIDFIHTSSTNRIKTIGYSNLTLDNVKHFSNSHIFRIELNCLLKSDNYSLNKNENLNTNKLSNLINSYIFNDFDNISSMFNYLYGNFNLNGIIVFCLKLIKENKFIEDYSKKQKLISSYFINNQSNNIFYFFNCKIFNLVENSFVKNIIFSYFIKNGVLIDNFYSDNNTTKIRYLIMNNLLNFPDTLYVKYKKFLSEYTLQKNIPNINNASFNLENIYNTLNYINEYYSIFSKTINNKDCLLDEDMDKYILDYKFNYHIYQIFLRFNKISPNIVLKNYSYLKSVKDIYCTMNNLIFCNLKENYLFEISLVNLKNFKLENLNDVDLIFLCSLLYYKKRNIEYIDKLPKNFKKMILKFFTNNLSNSINNNLSAIIDLNFAKSKSNNKYKFYNDNIEYYLKDNSNIAYNNMKFNKRVEIENLCKYYNYNTYTPNKDTSIKDIVNNYYSFFSSINLSDKWLERHINNNIKFNELEFLLENGRVIDSFLLYRSICTNENLSQVTAKINYICFNNLLNYNIFASCVTFLYLINPKYNKDNHNRDLIVLIEAANRILYYELSRNNDKNFEKILEFICLKNYRQSINNYDSVYSSYSNNIKNNTNILNSKELEHSLKEALYKYKILVSEFQKLNINQNYILKTGNVTFNILKRLEDATIKGDRDKEEEMSDDAKEITQESPWHLVSQFCKVTNYEMSLTLLHKNARKNNWILFLYKAQEQDCRPSNVKQILDGYFQNRIIATHIGIIIEELISNENTINENLDINSNLDKCNITINNDEDISNSNNINTTNIVNNCLNSSNYSVRITNNNTNNIQNNNNIKHIINYIDDIWIKYLLANINSEYVKTLISLNKLLNIKDIKYNNISKLYFLKESQLQMYKNFIFNTKIFCLESFEYNDSFLNLTNSNNNNGTLSNDNYNNKTYKLYDNSGITDIIVYSFKNKQISKDNTIYEPIYFISSLFNNSTNILNKSRINYVNNNNSNLKNLLSDSLTITENHIKFFNIMSEAIYLTWKDMIFVALIFTNKEKEFNLIAFTCYLYLTLKEIVIKENKIDSILDNLGINLLNNICKVFEDKKRYLKLFDLEVMLKMFLINNYCQLLIETLNLFDISYGLEEFVLFCESFYNNDFEQAFIHLFIFKNSFIDALVFHSKDNNILKSFINSDETMFIENDDFTYEDSDIKSYDDMLLFFFYQLINSTIRNLLDLYINEEYKLFKLLEILYQVKWNKSYSIYYMNLCVFNNLNNNKLCKRKEINSYKYSVDEIIKLLIKEKEFNILSEYIQATIGIENDDSMLYMIFSLIESFETNYILYNDIERAQFWDILENILNEAKCSPLQLFCFFWFIIEIKVKSLYIREQILILFKLYKYIKSFNNYFKNSSKDYVEYVDIDKNNLESMKSASYSLETICNNQKDILFKNFTIFMKNIQKYAINTNIKINELYIDLEFKIIVSIFSSCNSKFLEDNSSVLIDINNIFANSNLNINNLIDNIILEHSSVDFNSNFCLWDKIENSQKNNSSKVLESNLNSNNTIKNNDFSKNQNNKINILNKKTCFTVILNKSCINLLNLSFIELASNLCIYYNIDVDEVIVYRNLVNFVKENYYKIIKLSDLGNIFSMFNNYENYNNNINNLDFCNLYDNIEYEKLNVNNLDSNTTYKSLKKDFIQMIDSCKKYKSIDNIVIYQVLKVLLSNILDLDINVYLNFENNIEYIFSLLIENKYNDLLMYLNITNKNNKLLANSLIEKFYFKLKKIKAKNTLNNTEISLLDFCQYFSNKNELIQIIKKNIDDIYLKNNKLSYINTTEYSEILIFGYYICLTDCQHNNLLYFIKKLDNYLKDNSYKYKLIKLFKIYNDKNRAREIFCSIDQLSSTYEKNNEREFDNFKNKIEFYDEINDYKILGEIYIKKAEEYLLLSNYYKDKNKLKKLHLISLNFYIRAAEMLIKDSCITKYSYCFDKINYIINNIYDEVNINLS